jgi:hypothetical protein
MSVCPNCAQPLPDPPESFCPNCGAALGGAPRLSPGGSPGAFGIPWEQRGQLGLVNAFVENSGQTLTAPRDFFRRMPVAGGLPAPLLYGVLAGYLGLLASALYSAGFNTALGLSSLDVAGTSDLHRVLEHLQSGVGLVLRIVIGPVQVIVGLFLASAIYHLLLMLFGGARRDFEATFRVVAYAEAASLLLLVPVCGLPVSSVYRIVLLIIGLSQAHGIGRGTASAAVLVPLLLLCCCCCLAGIALFGGVAGIFGLAGLLSAAHQINQ